MGEYVENKKIKNEQNCENNKVLIEYFKFLLQKLDNISKHVSDELCEEIKKLSSTKRKYLNDIKMIDLSTLKNKKILLSHLNQLNQMSLFELQHLLTLKNFEKQIHNLNTIEDLKKYINDFHLCQAIFRIHINSLMSYLNSDLINYVDLLVEKEDFFKHRKNEKLKKYKGSLFLAKDNETLSQNIKTNPFKLV